MHNAAGGSLQRHVHNSNKSSALFRQGWCSRVQQAEAAGNILILLRRSRDYIYSTLTLLSLLTPQILLTSYFLCGYAIRGLQFCVCHMFKTSLTPEHILYVGVKVAQVMFLAFMLIKEGLLF